MGGIVELESLLTSLDPEMPEDEYVFCSVPGNLEDYVSLNPAICVSESEGLTLVLPLTTAMKEGFSFHGTYRKVTCKVHSSLEAVGLTAAVSSQLALDDIPANVVAGFYHDHIFVPADKAERALKLLVKLSGNRG